MPYTKTYPDIRETDNTQHITSTQVHPTESHQLSNKSRNQVPPHQKTETEHPDLPPTPDPS
jgi:hypothetical protein